MTHRQTEIVDRIFDVVEKHAGVVMTPNSIAKEAKLHYNTVKKYLPLIEDIQSKPEIRMMKTSAGYGFMVESRDLLSLPEEEQIRIIRNDYFPEVGEEDVFLTKLLKVGATSREKAIKVKMKPFIKKGIDAKRYKKTNDGRLYLTSLGVMMARGALDIYPELE